MNKIRLVTCLLLCCATFAISTYAKSSEQSLDQIVAVVNDDAITQTELRQALSVAKAQIAQSRIAAPPERILQKQVLDQLVNKKLQLQIAKQTNIEVDEDELDKTIDRIAKENRIPVSTIYQQINREGISTVEYRKEMREQLTIQKLQQKEIIPRITITPQEVSAFMHSQTWQHNETKEYRLEDILVPISDTPSPKEITAARKQAETILVKLRQGQSFRELALAESGDNHAFQGGDLGWRKLPEIPSAFANQIVHMQIKEMAGPIQAPNGFHIIRLTGIRNTGANNPAFNHKQVEQLLLQRKFEEAVQNWISKLRSQSFITMNLES